MLTAGCGKYVRDQGRSPVQVLVTSLQAAAGADSSTFGVPLLSDVITDNTVLNDLGQVTMELILKDPGQTGTTASPSSLNQVTINRYHVSYRRADGRNTEGVDVPYGFDSAVTFTIPSSGSVTSVFELVRHDAKMEAPLRALVANGIVITTIADVTFYGRDLAGNEVSATGSIQVDFGNFADPSSK
jgi:hypothetical protein